MDPARGHVLLLIRTDAHEAAAAAAAIRISEDFDLGALLECPHPERGRIGALRQGEHGYIFGGIGEEGSARARVSVEEGSHDRGLRGVMRRRRLALEAAERVVPRRAAQPEPANAPAAAASEWDGS